MWFQWQFLTNSMFIVNIDVHWLILEINICTIFACSSTKHLNWAKFVVGAGHYFDSSHPRGPARVTSVERSIFGNKQHK